MRSRSGRFWGTLGKVALGGAVAILLSGAARPRSALNVAIVWVMDPPFSPVATHGDVFTRPWIRLEALRSDLWMAGLAARYPVHVTFAIAPSLISGLEAYERGASDQALELAAIPAVLLGDDQKRAIYESFWGATGPMTAALPRYRALATKPMASYTVRDWRDLQVLSNLAWLSPSDRRAPEIAALVRQGRNFTETQKQRLLAFEHRQLSDVLPTFAQLQRIGRIAIAACPANDAILPLLGAADVARQVRRGMAVDRQWLGTAPWGLWPSHGAIASSTLPILAKQGVRWVAARGPQSPDRLTTPLETSDGPIVLVADRDLAHRITSVYPSWNGVRAARDLVARLHAIARGLDPARPHLLTIVVDGQKTWNSYPDGGQAFVATLYRLLAHDREIRTVTPSMAEGAACPVAGALPVRPATDPSRWTGRPAQDRAWKALEAASAAVGDRPGLGLEKSAWNRAVDLLLQAEDGGWFEALGASASTPATVAADRDYRALLSHVYRQIGQDSPLLLDRPFVRDPLPARAHAIAPPLDGKGGAPWRDALEVGPPPAAPATPHGLADVQIGHDVRNLYLAADFAGDPRALSFALGVLRWPGGLVRAGVDFPVQFLVDLVPDQRVDLRVLSRPPGQLECRAVWRGDRVEVAIPWRDLDVRGGEDLAIEPLALGASPFTPGPIELTVPHLAARAVVRFTAGPSTASCDPHDRLAGFAVEDDGPDWGFVFHLAAMDDPLEPFARPVPILDAYLSSGSAELDGPQDPRPLLPGRRARSRSPWFAAVTVHGQEAGLYLPQGDRALQATPARVVLDPVARTVSVRVDKRLVPGDPSRWGYLVGASEDGASFADVLGQGIPVATQDPVLSWMRARPYNGTQ